MKVVRGERAKIGAAFWGLRKGAVQTLHDVQSCVVASSRDNGRARAQPRLRHEC